MAKYSTSELRSIFQQPFNRDAWKAITINIFKANKLRNQPELFSSPEDPEQGYYMGVIETPDCYRIGLFYYKITTGSVAHKKVGLRNLVKKFINQNWGEFDAAIVIFDDKKEWRLSFVCDIKDVATAPKRFTYVFGEHDNFYRTAIERFELLQNEEASFKNIRDAFSVDALSDDFFEQYRELYADFVQYITGKRYVKESNKWVERQITEPNYQFASSFEEDDKLVRDYIKKMFGRIVFLYFLQRKGWLNNNRHYMHDLFVNSDKKDNFLDGVLEPLFFDVLNEKPEYRSARAKTLPGCDNIPYLNGGLFANDDIDDRDCILPEELFKQLFDFLDSYNFTIDENDNDDAEIGIDPEMLGRIFENLLEDNKDKGAFYTPKEIVDYMCRESIIAYLVNELPTIDQKHIRGLVENMDTEPLDDEQRKAIRRSLQLVKICDPAIGSGAFPMGLVNLLSKLYVTMKVDTDTAKMKRHIMEQNIYGVDIEKGAVDIARLRFWLAMIVEEKKPMPLPNLHFKIMQGNSLLESYQGVDLSDMTKVKPKTRSLFDSDDSERETLVADLRKYYATSDHAERDYLFNEIIKNVRRQLFAKDITLPQGMDLSANTEFFLWHTWFADVFENGGFDIVIGNPPYIDSETMIQLGLADQRNYISSTYKYITGNWDMYMAFLEKGIAMSKCVMCFITPDKWLSKPFGKKFRQFCMKKLQSIVHAGNNVFDEAKVDAIITLFIPSSDTINGFVFNSDKKTEKCGTIFTNSLVDPYLIDSIFSENATLIQKIDDIAESHISSYVRCESACSTGDAYKLVSLIRNEDNAPSYRLVNTGTIDKFSNRWGQKEIVYLTKELGYRPLTPYVAISEFEKNFGKTYITKAKGPKIILKGLNLLDVFVDEDGIFLPGKTTLVINSTNIPLLYFISAILNSAFAIFYLKTKYSSSSYCGGITFTKDMINGLPIPPITIEDMKFLSNLAKEATIRRAKDFSSDISSFIALINEKIYHLYKLSYDEVLIVDPETPITREEYENFNIEDICLD